MRWTPPKFALIDGIFSVDANTDELIQEIIRNEFGGCTIIAIVHKLHTILDFDLVVLLEKGCIIEVGNPLELLADSASSFRRLYDGMLSDPPSRTET